MMVKSILCFPFHYWLFYFFSFGSDYSIELRLSWDLAQTELRLSSLDFIISYLMGLGLMASKRFIQSWRRSQMFSYTYATYVINYWFQLNYTNILCIKSQSYRLIRLKLIQTSLKLMPICYSNLISAHKAIKHLWIPSKVPQRQLRLHFIAFTPITVCSYKLLIKNIESNAIKFDHPINQFDWFF